LKTITVWIIGFYQKYLSGLKGRRTCRFYPTCSEYSKQAIVKYGIVKGSWLSVRRISRCHPFNEGGHDPVK